MDKISVELDANLVLNYVDDDIGIYEPVGTGLELRLEPKKDTSFDENQNPKDHSTAPITADIIKKEKDLIIVLENAVLTPKKRLPVEGSSEANDSEAVSVEFDSTQPLNTPKIENGDLKRKVRSSKIAKDSKNWKTKKLIGKEGFKKLKESVVTEALELAKPKRGRKPKGTETSKLTTSKVKESKNNLVKVEQQDGVAEGEVSMTPKPKRGRPKGVSPGKLSRSVGTTKLQPSTLKKTKKNVKIQQDDTAAKPKRGRPKGALSKKVVHPLVPKTLENSKTNDLENKEVVLNQIGVPVEVTKQHPSKIEKVNLAGEQRNAPAESKGLETPKPKRGRPKGVRQKKDNISVLNKNPQHSRSKNLEVVGMVTTQLNPSLAKSDLDSSNKAITLKALGLEAIAIAASTATKDIPTAQVTKVKNLAAKPLGTSAASCKYLVPSKGRRGRPKGLKTNKVTFSVKGLTSQAKKTDIMGSQREKELNTDLNVKELNLAMSKINLTSPTTKKAENNIVELSKPKQGRPRKNKVNPIAVIVGLELSKTAMPGISKNLEPPQPTVVQKNDLVGNTLNASGLLSPKSQETEKLALVKNLTAQEIKRLYSLSSKSKASRKKRSGVGQPNGIIETIDLEVPKVKRAKVLMPKKVNFADVVIDLEQPKLKETKKRGRRPKQLDVSKKLTPLEPKNSIDTVVIASEAKEPDDVAEIIELELPKKRGRSKDARINKIPTAADVQPNRNIETIVLDLPNPAKSGDSDAKEPDDVAEILELGPPKKRGRYKDTRINKVRISADVQPNRNIETIVLDLPNPAESGDLEAKDPDDVAEIIELGPPKKQGRSKDTRIKRGRTSTAVQPTRNIETIVLDLPNPAKSVEQPIDGNNMEKPKDVEPPKTEETTMTNGVANQSLEPSTSRVADGKRKLGTSEGNKDFIFTKPKRVKTVKAFFAPKETKPAKSEKTESVEQKQTDASVGTSDIEPPKVKEAEIETLPKKPIYCTVSTQTMDEEEEDIPKLVEEKSSEEKASVSSVGTQAMESSKPNGIEVTSPAKRPSVSFAAAEVVILDAAAARNAEGQNKLGASIGKRPVELASPKKSKISESQDNKQNDEAIKDEEESLNNSVIQPAPTSNVGEDAREMGVKYESMEQIHTEFKYESQSETEEMLKRRRMFGRSIRGRRRGKVEGQTKIDNYVRIVDLNGKIQLKCYKQIYKCEHCLYVGNSKANLERHSLIHRNPDEIIWFHCTECSYKSKYEHQLKSHFLVHMKPEQIHFFQCPHCDLKCSRKHNLNNHIKSIHTNREYSFKCAECDYTTFSKDRLVAHIRKHSNEVHACTQCKFVTKRKEYLEAHFKKHMEEVPRPFPCDTCSYKGKTKRELDKHYDRMHNKDNLHVYQCNHCSFNSIYKKNLEFHLLHMHNNSEGFTKFVCGHCQKTFAYKNGLKVHIIRCHIRLPDDCWHKCLECKYRSKDVSTLKRHIKRNHGAPRLHCKQCSFATNRQVSMDAHLKTHEYDNEDILKCPECPYRILQMTSFLYHMKVIHGKPIFAKEAEQYYMQDE